MHWSNTPCIVEVRHLPFAGIRFAWACRQWDGCPLCLGLVVEDEFPCIHLSTGSDSLLQWIKKCQSKKSNLQIGITIQKGIRDSKIHVTFLAFCIWFSSNGISVKGSRNTTIANMYLITVTVYPCLYVYCFVLPSQLHIRLPPINFYACFFCYI